jgi:Domain of unknown function (DUF5666)
MKQIALLTTLSIALVAASTTIAGAAAPASDAQAAPLREFEGNVVSVNRDARRFRLRDAERGTVRIKVTRRTHFERVDGLAGLKAGMRNIEAKARRNDGRWVAVEVERSGGGGEHGGGDRPDGVDDNPSADDPA